MRSARLRGASRRILMMTMMASTAWVACAQPVAAQPYGPAHQVELSVVDGQPQATLSFGGADDVTYLASSLGVLGEERSMLDGAVAPHPGDADLLVRSPEFADHLARHLRLSRDGAPCVSTLVVPSGTGITLVTDSVTLTFRCPGTAPSVVADIDLLVDLHPAYRTQVRGPGGQQAVFGAEASRHAFDLPGLQTSTQASDGAGWWNHSGLLAAGAGLVVLVGAAVRRRGRSRSRPQCAGASA